MTALFASKWLMKGMSTRAGVWLFLLTLLSVMSLAACGMQTTGTTVKSEDFQGVMLVSFASKTPYSQALREITDQNFQPGQLCSAEYTTSSTTYTTLWQPKGQQDTYSRSHQLYVFQSMTTSSANRSQLWHLADVQNIRHVGGYYQGQSIPPAATARGDYVCPTVIGTPPSSTSLIWTANNTWYTTTVTFTAPLSSYDAALYTVSNLGLGLDSACNAQAPVGQEQSFAATHSLRVQTDTGLTSTLWLSQLRQVPGVASVATPTQHPPC